MQEASALQDTVEEELAYHRKVWADLRTDAEATEARRSKELSTKVSEGERSAKCDDAVITAKKAVNNAKYICDLTEAKVHRLERIYFSSKDALERGFKKYGR